jgi:hypothetical protein
MKQTIFLLLVIGAIFVAVAIMAVLSLLRKVEFGRTIGLLCSRAVRAFFWSGFVRIILQCYLDFSVTALLLFVMQGSFIAAAVGVTLGLVGFLAYTGWWLKMKQADLDAYEETVGTLFRGIKTEKLSSIMYYIVFMVRRLAFATITVFAGPFDGGLSIVLAVSLSISYHLYLLIVKPNRSRKVQYLEVIGEVLLLYSIFGIMFCEYDPDPLKKYRIGWFSVGCVVSLILLHVINLLREAVVHAYYYIKRVYTQYRQESQESSESEPSEAIK